MSKFSKKFVSGALSITTGVWLSGALMFVPVAHGQSVTDLQAQISALLAQIQQLQAQLSSQTGGGSSSYTFTRDLTVGSTGDDVKALQQMLNSNGYQVSASGAGAPGSESTYFGTKTQAALAKFQAAKGISPAVGYFGPKTRAAVAGMGGGTGTTPPPGVVVPGTGLSVGLASDSPAAGSLISSSGSAAARVPVLAVNLTAGSAAGVTVNELKFMKQGVLSDSAISSAYLIESGKVLTQFSSLNQGKLVFSGLGLSVNAGQTRKLWLAIDPATGLSAGNTVSFALMAASDVMAVDNTNAAVTVSGAFPAKGSVFTVTSVSNPSIASLIIASSSVGTSVYAGTQNVLVSQWTLTGTNSPLNLSSLNFKVIGSANKGDIKNVKLFVNGNQVGPTLAQVAADGSAYFDLSSAPIKINTGSSNMQVYADIMGSPSYNFQFELLNSYDVLAIDTQYSVPVSITVNGGTGVQISILQGTLTVSLASDTPTGNIAKGGSGVAFAKFTIYAAGEPVKVKWLTFKLLPTGTGLGNNWDAEIKNVVLVDDAGNQVGTTINSLVTSVTCTDTSFSASTSTGAINCFGNSSSPINYLVPANTTRVLTLRGDVQSGAGFSTIVASLTGNTSNLQGQTSSQTASSGSVNGGVLSLAANSLTVAKNTAVGTQTASAGAVGMKIGSYSLSANSAEGVNLSSITIATSASSTRFQNLKLMLGSTQVGVTQPTLSASASYTFSGSVNIPAGQTKVVDVIADVLSGTVANTYTVVTTLSGCSGSGAATYTSVSCTSTAGQDLVVAGQSSVTITSDSGQAASDQLVMGSTGTALATFRLTETSNIEDVKITDLYVSQAVAATSTIKSAFSNLQLYNGSTWLASAGSATGNGSGTTNVYYYKFSFGAPVVVPRANSTLLVLKGDVASYSSSGATDNTTHVFKIATSTDAAVDTVPEVVVALGNTSNATSAVTLSSANGNTMTTLRSKISFNKAPLGSASGRAKSASDNLATLTFAADSAGAVAVNSVIVTFGGTAPSIATFLDGVTLIDENGSSLGTANTTSATACNGTNTCSKIFNLGSTTNGQSVSAGSSRTWTLRIDSTKTAAGTSGVSQTLTATINALTDVRYTDALDSSAATTVSLPTKTVVPIDINSVTFSQGS